MSIVELPWRRLVHAARWKGSAPHTTTGAARVRESHCQLVNCHAGTIAIATTGTVSTSETSSRWRRDAAGIRGDRLTCCGRRGGERGGVPRGLDHGQQVVGADVVRRS